MNEIESMFYDACRHRQSMTELDTIEFYTDRRGLEAVLRWGLPKRYKRKIWRLLKRMPR